jgi:hypothetical protein
MHYIFFLGIFGMPVVLGVGMLVAKVWDAFAPEDWPARGNLPADELHDMESHVNALVDTFFSPPVDQNPTQ